MRKAIITNKAFFLFTLFFIAIAAFSFVAFQETEAVCTNVKCSEARPANNRGQMAWDVFTSRIISLVSYR